MAERLKRRVGVTVKTAVPLLLSVVALNLVGALLIGSWITRVHEDESSRLASSFATLLTSLYGRYDAQGHAQVRGGLPIVCQAADRNAFVTDARGIVTSSCVSAWLGTSVSPRRQERTTLRYDDHEWQRWVWPVEAAPACLECHHEGGVLGYLGVDVPVDELHEEVRQQQELNLLVGLVLASVLSVVLVLVLVKLVQRPLHSLGDAMARLHDGDLTARVTVGAPDEIGELGERFNVTAERLERAHTELLRTHRAELAQSEKLAALGQLFSSVAHELKNQLTGLVGVVKVLDAGVGPEDPNKEVIARVLNQTERMSRTAVAALDFAKPLKRGAAAVDVNALLDRTLFFVERQAQEQGITLRRRYAPELPTVLVDEDAMKQVFLNLVLNGLQAMGAGGVLEVETRRSGAAVEVTVADQGMGIAPENLARVFSPFFTTKASGTGLGLYVARQLVETQRGELEVASTVGQGSLFTVRLPLAQEH